VDDGDRPAVTANLLRRGARDRLQVMTFQVIDSMTGHRHGRVIGKASGLAAQQMKRTAMCVFRSFQKIADHLGSVLPLLATVLIGGATVLIGG
jgi:hypothetical protein